MDPYKILGVSSNATLQEIRTAYEEREQRYSPAKGGDDWAFQQLQEAYEELLKRHDSTEHRQPSEPSKSNTSQTTENSVNERSTTDSFRPREAALVAGIIGLLLVLIFWQWAWRPAMILSGFGCAIATVWCYRRASKGEANASSRVVARYRATALCLIGCFIFLGIGFSYSPRAALTDDELTKSSVIVHLTMEEADAAGEAQGHGSGLVVSQGDGKLRVFTNSHCLGLADLAHLASEQTDRRVDVTKYNVVVQFPSGKKKPAVRVAETTLPGEVDVACIEVESDGLVEGEDYLLIPTIEDALSTLRVRPGDEVIAIGTPLFNEFAGTQTFGRVSSVRVFDDDPSKTRWIQHDAAIAEGNSGGPLFLNRDGDIYWIGINTIGVTGTSMAFAISSEDVVDADLQWADAGPGGAVQIIGQVYGAAAGVGKKEPPLLADDKPELLPKLDSPNWSISKPVFELRRTTSESTEVKQPSWPFKKKFPFLDLRTVIPLLMFLYFLNGIFRDRARNSKTTKKCERVCPRCGLSSNILHAEGHCPECEYKAGDIRVNCPACGRTNIVAASNVGTTIQCLHCERRFDADADC